MPEKDPIQLKIDALTDEDLKHGLDAFLAAVDPSLAVTLNSCVRCGLCASTCAYSLANPGEPKNAPYYKVDLVASVYQRYSSPLGRRFPFWNGAREFNRETVALWVDALFGRCTLCGRCYINCSIGLAVPALIRAGRGALTTMGLIPEGLDSTVSTAVEKGNNMGIAENDWVETLEWLEEELQGETEDPKARIFLEERGTRSLYTVNPREPKFFPLSIVAAAKIFHAAGESWTLPRHGYDITNYGLFVGNKETSRLLANRIWKEAEELDVERILLGECGHGFTAQRWESPSWFGRLPPVPEESIVQRMVRFLQEKRITLDPALNPGTYTLHDPCNLVRMGGVVEEPRILMKAATQNFVEMTPNREKNFCCGGGGGQLAMSRYSARRLETGKIKADQIAATGAKVVVAPCHNCIDQLMELNKHYKLGVQVKSLVEVVAQALVFPKERRSKGE